MAGARPALWGRHRRAVGAAAPRCTTCAGLPLGRRSARHPARLMARARALAIGRRLGWAESNTGDMAGRGRSYSLWSNRDFGFGNRLDPVPPGKRWRSGSSAANGGGPRGKRPPPWQSRARVYADCREGPALWAALHRPGATRHPWRDAPFCGHPDRAPPPVTPPRGPTDGAGFCG
jgi:hypothetical protein